MWAKPIQLLASQHPTWEVILSYGATTTTPSTTCSIYYKERARPNLWAAVHATATTYPCLPRWELPTGRLASLMFQVKGPRASLMFMLPCCRSLTGCHVRRQRPMTKRGEACVCVCTMYSQVQLPGVPLTTAMMLRTQTELPARSAACMPPSWHEDGMRLCCSMPRTGRRLHCIPHAP